MRGEDLFRAIGSVEESRLARSEMALSSGSKEDKIMQVRTRRFFRSILVAAVMVSLLAVTAYAVTGFLIFDSPEEMISAIFGDNTGFDHGARGEILDEEGSVLASRPGFERIPVDETVVAEDVAPYVSPIGQSVTGSGYTLTVDAFMYDAATKCGFVTYMLKNPDGIPYKLQYNGEIWYKGMPDPVQVNEYGYPYIILEKTTNTCLAVTYYFRNTGLHGDTLVLSLPCEEKPLTEAQLDAIILELDTKIRQELTAEEAIEEAKERIGQRIFEQQSEVPEGVNMTQEEWDAERAYTILRDLRYQEEYEQKGPSIIIPMVGTALNHAVAKNGAVTISPISFQLDATELECFRTESMGNGMAEVSGLKICFADGSEYDVMGDSVDNTIFRLIDSASGGEEDLYNRYTCMFNRIIDVDTIATVVINGTELPVD